VSMGAGISMSPRDIAFECSFATLDVATGIVTSRRADRHFEHLGPTLCAALDGEETWDDGSSISKGNRKRSSIKGCLEGCCRVFSG